MSVFVHRYGDFTEPHAISDVHGLLLGLERYRYRVSVSNRYLQYRHRTDTKKVSLPIPG